MELIKREKLDLLLTPENIEFLRKYEEMKDRFKVLEDQIKKTGEEFLAENNLTDYEQDGVSFKRTKDTTRIIADTDKMKEEGVYELYSKEVPVKGSLKISFKWED